MLRIDAGTTMRYCDGLSRRSFLQIGMAGMGSLTLPQLARAREQSVQTGTPRKDTSVILLWLDGGPSHMDLYDLKPEAPAEYRGLWNPIHTNVSGFEISELFPLQAQIADKFSIVRSLHHDTGDHFTAGHWILTGHGGVSGADTTIRSPSIGSMATKLTGARQSGMPAYVAVPYAAASACVPGYFGADFLGVQHNPFETGSIPTLPTSRCRTCKCPAR